MEGMVLNATSTIFQLYRGGQFYVSDFVLFMYAKAQIYIYIY